jgi:hypothetical protein
MLEMVGPDGGMVTGGTAADDPVPPPPHPETITRIINPQITPIRVLIGFGPRPDLLEVTIFPKSLHLTDRAIFWKHVEECLDMLPEVDAEIILVPAIAFVSIRYPLLADLVDRG